jgi:hypothetical protein
MLIISTNFIVNSIYRMLEGVDSPEVDKIDAETVQDLKKAYSCSRVIAKIGDTIISLCQSKPMLFKDLV